MWIQKRSIGYLWLVLLLVLWILLAVVSYRMLALPRQHRFDFYPLWLGAKTVLAGETPYTQQVTWRIQEGMFGHRLGPGEDEQRFAYPAVLAWILFPFLFLSFPLAVSLWCGLQLVLLLVLPIAVATLLGWQVRPLRMAILLICSLLLYRYPINVYILGQFIPLVLVCIVGAWWGTINDRPVITSVLLVVAAIRPELSLFPILVFFAAAWRQGRWKAVGLWIGLMGSLWMLMRVWIGPWVMDWLNNVQAYTGYSYVRWPPLMVGSGWVAWLLTIAILIWGGWMLMRVRSLPIVYRLPWEVSIAVLVGLTVLPQTNNYTLILGLLPVWVALWASRGRWLDWIPVLVVLAMPWVFYAMRDIFPIELERLLIPLMLCLLLAFRWRAWAARQKAIYPRGR